MEWIWYGIAGVLCVATFPGTLELFFLTLGAILGGFRKTSRQAETFGTYGVIIIPAHNEELHIGKTLEAILQCGGNFKCVVIADNCSDATVEICRQYQVQVLERKDEEHKGKAYALDFAFKQLLKEPYDWFAVVDADTLINPNFVLEIGRLFDKGADAVQVRNAAGNPHASIKTRLMCIAFLAFNYVRPKGREFWGWSVGILGTGFALSRTVLTTVPYALNSIVEDLAYHLRLVKAGFKVHFTDRTQVCSDFPLQQHGVITQRTRWEGGRFFLMRTAIPQLICEMATKGHWSLLEPLADLLLLPLGYHVGLLLLLCFIPVYFFQVYAVTALIVVAWHVLTAIVMGGGGLKDLAALALAPFYIIWKLFLLAKTIRFSKHTSAWVRTDRHKK